ncbi:glycogen/starch/alpha-glucan phosphorylase [Thiocystis violacea]|uniref:glycogen/starch/alpha-glucan phosphorylase n=1 Tax=Thiocystis violacea TaxID=13725 RepID=UPI001905C4A8|nr:glycogen/starch/alpha-glucan phosphorylase [Thiocystis violacea]MBK1716577.1 glycogen phosphorylase [Thiocystis violacea]
MSSLTNPIKNQPNDSVFDLPPLSMEPEGLANDFKRYYAHTFGRDRDCHSAYYPYKALAITLRDRLMERWKVTRQSYDEAGSKRAYYLSLEFLMGRALSNAMLNLEVDGAVEKGLYNLGLELEEIASNEPDPGLGNGGLGRLAACFLDSCASLQLPVRGYGLRYEYGMFRQLVENGEQVEEPDHWLRDGNPWELERPEFTQRIQFGGRTESYTDQKGRTIVQWVDSHDVLAVPYDIPVPGYRNNTVNTLRLWKAAATDDFDLDEFNAGSYPESVAQKNAAEHITMVLYPNDASENGKELRLRQQFFLASASIKDVLRDWIRLHGADFSRFAELNCFQLNDTHPAVSVAELMRQLMDEHGLEWGEAWNITRHTMAYTNHTLLPEALERWPVRLFRQLLPRVLEIIFEINARFLAEVALRWPGDIDRQRRMSLIEEGYDPQVRMAYLAIVGSYSVNGVAALHSELLIEGLFRDFHDLWPAKFNNKTNGVTPRRWLAQCNPGLRTLLDETIGTDWVRDLDQLARLVPHAEDAAFRERWHQIKQDNKAQLAEHVAEICGVNFPLDAIFDVQVKRIHEYKRQLLNVLHVIHLYNRIKRGDTANWAPRCVLIGGKAAPGYVMAKQIIRLVNNVARVVNMDPSTEGLLRVAFVPDYRVSLMEVIAPGTDLSEQISTAGKEASGTGNMKFMMNGAITIGTLDGANIEIRDQVGEENFFLFGLTAAGVESRRHHYDPNGIIAGDPALMDVMNLLESGHFNQFEGGVFDQVILSVRNPHDPWMTAADFRGYIEAQEQAAAAYRDRERWVRMSILNAARSGHFSSDRTIGEYNRDIWRLTPVAPGR